MNIAESVKMYTDYIKKNAYVYEVQKPGIEAFMQYINSISRSGEIKNIEEIMLDKLLLYWIPRNKRYLSEIEAYQMVYTIQDVYNFILKQNNASQKSETPSVLEMYAEEYMRVYRIRNMLLKITHDPIIATHPYIVDLNNYRNRKKRTGYNGIGTTYEQAVFKVEQCKEVGQIVLKKCYHDKEYKLLLEYPTYKYFKKGDLLHAIIKRKLFYVYWELEEIKSYYLPQAISYL